jgi:hypothetical protein
MRFSRWSLAVIAACVLIGTGVTAEAQVCGDADNNGSVTVTDGVQALRAAAGLSSTCAGNANCDVDGNGSVSVTDGVNILRKAADLPISEACTGSVDNQLETLLRSTVPIFGSLTKLAVPSGQAGAAEAFACENAGGTFEVDDQTGEISFFDCDIGGVNYDGFIGVDVNGTLFVEIDFVDLATDEFFSFSAELSSRQEGDNVVIAGPLEYSSSLLGDVALNFENVVVDPNANVIGGSLFFDASGSDIAGVTGIRLGFTPSTIIPVEVEFADQTTRNFDFDTVSGELTPVESN